MLAIEVRVILVADAVSGAARVGTVEKVVAPNLSTAVGFLLKPPFRLGEGSPLHKVDDLRKTRAIGTA